MDRFSNLELAGVGMPDGRDPLSNAPYRDVLPDASALGNEVWKTVDGQHPLTQKQIRSLSKRVQINIAKLLHENSVLGKMAVEPGQELPEYRQVSTVRAKDLETISEFQNARADRMAAFGKLMTEDLTRVRAKMGEKLGVSLSGVHNEAIVRLMDPIVNLEELRSVLESHPGDVPSAVHAFLQVATTTPERQKSFAAFARKPLAGDILKLYRIIELDAHPFFSKVDKTTLGLNKKVPLNSWSHYERQMVRLGLLLGLAMELNESHPSPDDEERLKEALAVVRDIFWHDSENIRLLREVLSQFTPVQLETLDMTKMEMVDRNGPHKPEEVPADIREEMIGLVRGQFPSGDDEDFKRYLTHDNVELHYLTLESKLLAFFGQEKIGQNLYYPDWLNVKDGPIPSVAMAMLLTALTKSKDERDFYFVAKPHVHAMTTLIEHLEGCVAFGVTKDGEYKHHYMRCRSFRSERQAYVTKAPADADRRRRRMLKEEMKRLRGLCARPDHLYEDRVAGKTVRMCVVSFADRSFTDDIDASDRDGFMFRAMQECAREGFVMTRMVPDPGNSVSSQEYLCVFEEAAMEPDELRRFQDEVKTGLDKDIA